VGSSTTHNPVGLHGLLGDRFIYFLLYGILFEGSLWGLGGIIILKKCNYGYRP
jgi:hypothetical protein